MPRKLDIDSLRAEAAGLQALLNEAEEAGDLVGELQGRERMEEIKKEIAALESSASPLANVALFFEGKPVVGSRGISADFAGKALEGFQELVSRTFARKELGSLGERGRIPLRSSTDLKVTGLAHGSFGFVLEELSDQEQLHDTALKEMVHSAANVLFDVSSENERDFIRAIENVDSRTLISLRSFFKELDSSKATVRIVDDLQEYAFDRPSIERGRRRTEATEIEEQEQSVEGILVGFLPDHRKFELKIQSGETIYGSASQEATEQFEKAVGLGNLVLGHSCTAQLFVRETRPLNSSPRINYRLVRFDKIGDAQADHS